MNYEQKRQAEWDQFIDAGGEGRFRPTPRTEAQIEERTISIEESIAVEMLRRDHDTVGVYQWAEDYIQDVIDYRNSHQSVSVDMITQMESVDDRTERNNGLARLYLANAIVQHRLIGFSGSETTTELGFGISITTSLAAAIVDYHRRVLHVLCTMSRNE